MKNTIRLRFKQSNRALKLMKSFIVEKKLSLGTSQSVFTQEVVNFLRRHPRFSVDRINGVEFCDANTYKGITTITSDIASHMLTFSRFAEQIRLVFRDFTLERYRKVRYHSALGFIN